ncbi:hypothetical protein F5Y01DRAFT_324313 [Xylaria sp. FL0043]|nr:hypothetical protein F5Y01DRAFT_324313 [Xylaria sp. FL0043]
MAKSVSRQVKPEPSTEPESEPSSPTRSSIVKPEPADVSSLSDIPSQNAGEAAPERRPCPSEEPDDAEPGEPDYLQHLCKNESLETLEAAVSVAADLLDQLQETLVTRTTPRVAEWTKTIAGLRERTTVTRTVVGVVGNTGAGKSSVINALLDEERLLPTNCLRACTASPTEISFNYSDDPQELYRAEIEFITSQEFVRELQVLFTDLLDGSGQISREATNADTDAGIAYAKVKAIYPQKTRQMLAEANPEDLANEPAVRDILGSTKMLRKRTAKELYRAMQHYVDSKEKSAGAQRADTPMEYWPLIKVVRIFTKANALSAGAVVVDLPGVQDSNAARAAVAANYMKACTGLWIVAPITRAVDDKTAKTLLGDSFKRQLKYDGTYSAVSFICSKTDDISNTEAADSLGLEAEMAKSWEAAEKMQETEVSLKSQLSRLNESKSALWQQLDQWETSNELWRALQSRMYCGETVYAPSNPKKRQRSAKYLGSRKNLKSDVDDDCYASDSDSSSKENSTSDQSGKPLTKEDIKQQLLSLREQRMQIGDERELLDSQIAELRREIEKSQAERETILADVKVRCIRGRNDYARSAIKHDFAMGIKELDQENAADEDDANFDPDEDKRDYDEVARNLPVFCVSSRAYQKLSGKLEKDDFQSHGFRSVEDTEIPKLQQHAKRLTETRRATHCRRFLNELCALVNSMKLWSAIGDATSNLTDDEKSQEEQHLKKLLGHLEEELESSLKQSISLIRAALQEQIFDNINASAPSAIDDAPDTAYSWGAPRSEGGLHWSTYKAIVRRQGAYCGRAGPRDFNQELFEPISRNLATGWERAFQRRLPAILNLLAKEVAKKLKHFHETAKARAEERRINAAGLVTLSSQILTHIRTVESLPDVARQKITESQRDASRQFTPAIREAMADAYTICTNEYGPGSYRRMKDAMTDHVDTARHSMFGEATEVVKGLLEDMCRSVFEDISLSIEAIFNTLCTEYMRALVGNDMSLSEKPTLKELDMRSRVNKVLLRTNKMFAPVLGEWVPEVSPGAGADDMEAREADRPEQEVNSFVDELIQADIREQDATGEMEEAEDDPSASEEEYPDITDYVKTEQEPEIE